MKVAIFGAGYVGLVTGACLSSLGHEVVCVDVNLDRVKAINAGQSPIYEPGLDALLRDGLGSGRFKATEDARAALAKSQVSMVAVGTPPRDGRIDLTYVLGVAATIGDHIRDSKERHTVVVKSTVVPGTTEGPVREALERHAKKKAGADFGSAMNPEFLREGSAIEDFMQPDRIVIGQHDAASGDAVAELYTRFACPKLRVGTTNAEFIKYASNTLLATLVSFSNELYGLCEATPGADGETIMDGLALDRRLSPTVDGKLVSPGILAYLRGGVGYGGSCLPKDISALRSQAESKGLPVRLLDSVTAVNQARPSAIVDRLAREIGGLEGKTIAVLGLAFKAGTDDLRDSPAIPLVEALMARGASVRALDPQAMAHARALWGERVTLVDNPEALVDGADAALLATSWPAFGAWDWASLVKRMRHAVIVDGRNAMRHVKWPAGTTYVPVGRGPEAG